ncbi:MAG: LpxI family protein, partial [Bdellovibrionales bacterium]
MSAAKEIVSEPDIKTLAIIAGGGDLPPRLAQICRAQGMDVFIVALDGHTDPAWLDGYDHAVFKLGQLGKMIKSLETRRIKDLVMIGSVTRPSFKDLIPDLKGAAFLARYGGRAMGDDDLLSALKAMLGDEGFIVHGVHRFIADILAPKGGLGVHNPTNDDWVDIRRGVDVARGLGALDVGQAVVVQEGIVLGVEAAEGTDALIKRCAALKRGGQRGGQRGARGGVLVKLCKPQQDKDLDLPTIGPQTVQNAIDAGLA